ncbi:MAG: hypothetical protein IKV03_03870 [Alphaproteobacteria bacterium]|nr:hypothetical protein [Alphaproteobacteria bacterium]
MRDFIVKEHGEDIFYPMTVELAEHIDAIKQNVQPDGVHVRGYLSVSEKTMLKRRRQLCDMIDWLASTNTGRKILAMTSDDVQIFALSRHDKSSGGQFGEACPLDRWIILNPKQLYPEMRGECVDTLAHEMIHMINFNLKRHVLKTTYNNLNPYDEFCLHFYDEVSASIYSSKVFRECINQLDRKISVDDIMSYQYYWDQGYNHLLYLLSDYRRPLRQAKTSHTPSYYKLWRAYFNMYPELKWPELVRYIQFGAKRIMNVIHKDMKSHGIEPRGKKLIERYYPLVRHLRIQMSGTKEREG